MMNPTHTQAGADPWWDKADRFWLITALLSLVALTFAAYDGRAFYDRYMRLCSEEPGRAECRPLNLVKQERPPDLGITLEYEKGKWALDVGPRQEEAAANNLASRLRAYSIEPRVIRVSGKGKNARYQVQVGRFPTRKVANEAGAELQKRAIVQEFRLNNYQAVR
jgi:hypothetical protein